MKRSRNPSKGKQKTTLSPIWIVGLVVIVAAGILMIALLNSGGDAGGRLPPEISISDAFQRHEAGAFILDVREPEEWEEAHIPGSTLIPLGLLEGRVNELPRDRQIVVVCRSGNRSQSGRDILLQAGFEQVTSMSGGLNGWKSSAYLTVSGK
jgi:rhodanese-related sulfurtransferase